MTHKKPSGNIGHFRISVGEKDVKSSRVRIEHSAKKDEIEKYYCERFINAMRKNGTNILGFKQNEEDDFDFTLTMPGGKVSLDLAEVTINQPKISPYKKKDSEIFYKDYIDSVINIVKKKSKRKRYQESKTPIYLLFYCTHWRFTPADAAIVVIQYDLLQLKHTFENIFFYCPLDREEGYVRVLYPTRKEKFDSIDIEEIRNGSYFNLDNL